MDKNEPAYLTNEVAERLEQGDSTIRKWSLALEKQGHKFIKGEQERRLFLEDDIYLLTLVKEELKRQEETGEKKDLKAAAEFAYSKWITRLVPAEEKRTPLIPQNQFDYESISKMIVQEVSSFWMKKFEESEKRYEKREVLLLKKLEEQGERQSFLENDIREMKEQDKERFEELTSAVKRIESNSIDEVRKSMQKTNQMLEDFIKEIAATKVKKWWQFWK